MDTLSLFKIDYQRLALMLFDAILIAFAVVLADVVAFVGDFSILVQIQAFYTMLLYWLGTLLVFAYGNLYAKQSIAFTHQDLKWLAMMNIYVVGAVFLTQYVLNPIYWLFALLFMLSSFIVRTINSVICVLQKKKLDILVLAIIPFAIGAVVSLVLTPIIEPWAPLPDKAVPVPMLATFLYFVYSTVLLALGRYFQAWIVSKWKKAVVI